MVPVHPGSILREELETRSLSANALSRALRVNSGRIVEILNGKRAISADTALRLGRFFGNDAEFWMALQAQYDVALARRLLGKKLEREVLPANRAA
jgi:antitoxin HigA-1